MNVMILILLIVFVLYFALTYLKTPGNSNTNPNGLTTRPFGGGAAGNNGIPPELENAEVTDADDQGDETDAGWDFEADEAGEVDNATTNFTSLVESDFKAESTPTPTADPASILGEIPVTNTSTNPGVVLDSEVHIDAKMPSDTGAMGKPN